MALAASSTTSGSVAMALTTEDGTGLPDADSFISAADATQMVADLGLLNWPDDPQDQEPALRRASLWLSTYYRWRGSALNGRSQGLAWPRSGVVDQSGAEVPSDEVPKEVQRATVFAAISEAADPGVLTPTITPNQMAVMEKVGPLTIQYRKGARPSMDMSGVDDARPVLSAVYDQVRGLIEKPAFIGVSVA